MLVLTPINLQRMGQLGESALRVLTRAEKRCSDNGLYTDLSRASKSLERVGPQD